MLEMRHRGAQPGLIVEDEPEIIVHLGVVWPELQRPQKMRSCLIEIALVAERQAEIAVGPGVVGIKGEGLPVMIDRLVQRP